MLLRLSYLSFFVFISAIAISEASDPALAKPSGDQNPSEISYLPSKKNFTEKSKIAIIIDDLGYDKNIGKKVINLPGDITVSIIPFTPHAQTLARYASENKKEIMLHAPMETHTWSRWETGFDLSMQRTDIFLSLSNMLLNIPQARGLNNHGGSAFTQNPESMTWLLQTLARLNLYFIDSRTTPFSVAKKYASEHSTYFAERDVFLDNIKNTGDILRQIEKLVDISRKHGTAVGIGHPYPETIRALTLSIPIFKSYAIELVPASKLVLAPSGDKNTHYADATN